MEIGGNRRLVCPKAKRTDAVNGGEAVHLGLHFQLFIGLVKKIKAPEKVCTAVKWTLRAVLLGLAVYGAAAFAKRAMWEEMFMTTQFKFLPFGESPAAFLLDYGCVICLFAAIGHYSGRAISRHKKRRNINEN